MSVFDALFYRGYSRNEYAEALKILVQQNWLRLSSNDSGNYEVTAQGRAIHADVEAETDRYFYAPCYRLLWWTF